MEDMLNGVQMSPGASISILPGIDIQPHILSHSDLQRERRGGEENIKPHIPLNNFRWVGVGGWDDN